MEHETIFGTIYFAFITSIVIISIYYLQWDKRLPKYFKPRGYTLQILRKNQRYQIFTRDIYHSILIKSIEIHRKKLYNESRYLHREGITQPLFVVYTKLSLARTYLLDICPRVLKDQYVSPYTKSLELGDEYSVYGDDDEIFQFFKSDGLIDKFNSLCKLKNIGDLTLTFGNTSLEIKIEVVTYYYFLKYIEIIEDIVKELKLFKIIKEVESYYYYCYKCSEILEFDGDFCNKCQNLAPACILCLQDPEPGEEIAILLCCKSFVHLHHLEIWMNKSDACPFCRDMYILFEIVEDIKKTKTSPELGE